MNLWNFRFPLVNYHGKILCSSVIEPQKNSDVSSKEECILRILNVL